MISIIIPLYNKEKSIVRTVHSVLEQSYQDFEIIIVNDGSTDNSIRELSKVQDCRIRLVEQPNSGVSAARNMGITIAKGEFVAFLDADDEWRNDYLQTQYDLTLKYPQCDVFATNYEFKDIRGVVSNTIIRNIPFKANEGILSNYFTVASCSHPPLWTSAVMLRKAAIDFIGGFPVGVKSGEDLLTWARLAVRYRIAYTRSVKASFVQEGYEFKDKPKRIPADFDVVGAELNSLLESNANICGLRKYISHWHKMRSSCFLRLDMYKQSVREAFIGLKYNPLNFKLYIYILLNFIPSFMRPFK